MEQLDNKINLWIRERLIPHLTENERNAKFTISRPTGSFFVSDLFFVTVHSAKEDDKRVAVKLPSLNPGVTLDHDVPFDYDKLFTNEVLFYNQIAHGHVEDYPKSYLAGKDPTFKSVIVLEDVRPRGYTVSPKKVNVDLDYIVAGLKAIGRLHGHTYAIKEKEPVRFRQIVQSIDDSRYGKNANTEDLQDCINENIQRVLSVLRVKNGDSEFCKTMSKVFEDVFNNLMMKCVEPVEPLATIVHGDCTINNMLYRTDNNGQLQSMLIDFGLIMYSSPATDIATFLYMTCKREDIRDRAEDLFTIYHDSLTECLKEHGIWDPTKYSRQAFWQEYRERAVFGYVGAAVFFRFIMIIYERDNIIPEISDSMKEQFFQSTEGQDFLDLLIDMLDDLRVAGMLDHLIEKCK